MTTSFPPARQANYGLAILLLAYILSFIDRNILAMLVGPIREDFQISDFQFSILHGWAFTLFYIFLGLPIGWLADRISRKWIITLGVFFWSLMTILCGFAESFVALFLVRIGVGVGEAALSPPTYSLLSDFFDARRLRWATAIFAMGITLGSGLSYKIGGWVYDQLSVADFSTFGPFSEVLGQMQPWQLTFVAVGLPGFMVVALLMWMHEPARQGADRAVGGAEAELGPSIKDWFFTHWQAYCGLVFGVCMMAIIGYGTLGWFLEFLVRTYGMSKTDAGNALGDIFIFAGTAGTFAGAGFASLLQRRGYIDANMRLIMLVALLLIVPAVAAPLMSDARWAIGISWLVIFLHYTHFGVAMAALQLITPNRLRAQASALMLFMTNLFGLALGGTFVAFFTDFVYGDDQSLRYSLALVAAIVYPLAALFIGWGLKHYRRALVASGQ